MATVTQAESSSTSRNAHTCCATASARTGRLMHPSRGTVRVGLVPLVLLQHNRLSPDTCSGHCPCISATALGHRGRCSDWTVRFGKSRTTFSKRALALSGMHITFNTNLLVTLLCNLFLVFFSLYQNKMSNKENIQLLRT